MFSSDRNEIRKVFFEAWRKHTQHLPIEPLEAQLIQIILLHPEVHALLAKPQDFSDTDFQEANPFLHLGLHLALREQINTDRPKGIKQLYANLCVKYKDKHSLEHKMMDCLAEILWLAQQSGKAPDEQDYWQLLKKL
jgi:hypothetical protein